ncbi:hypothetical protein Avbf_05063 [Armadillidium vulgare]|nr:hypothetical protein Avbf_05063 [Armadillidium vulgare]
MVNKKIKKRQLQTVLMQRRSVCRWLQVKCNYILVNQASISNLD